MALALRDQDIQKYRLPQEDEGMSESTISQLVDKVNELSDRGKELRAKLSAKDAEIAELRQRVEIFQRGEAAALGMLGTATTERDEARECVKRLAQGLRNAASNSYGPDRAEALAVLAATPEHLR